MKTAQIVVSALVVALIVTFGFGAAFFLLLFVAGTYVLVALAAPIFVYVKLRLTAKPVVQPLSADDASIPETVRSQLDAHRHALWALGFEARDLIRLPATSAQSAYLALYRHPGTATRALSRVLLKPGKASTRVHSSEAEFEILYDNGTTVELSNVSTVVPGLGLVPGMARQMPHIRDVKALFDYFLKLTAKYERETGTSESNRIPLPDEATLTALYFDQLAKGYAIQQGAGLIEPTGKPETWRPSWRLAALVAAGAISPGLEFFNRRTRVRGSRLQRELDGDATRTHAERVGRLGWLMLAVGLAMIVAALLMSFPASSLVLCGIMIAWWIAGRGGREPGWRAIVIGGVAAIALLGIPIGLSYANPLDLPPQTVSEMLVLLGLYLLPMVLLVVGASLLIEGFRAAAT